MAFSDFSSRYYREPVWILEVYIDRCSLTYGTAPCTASTANPSLKCFNCLNTCQDSANINLVQAPLRFASRRIDNLQAAGDFPVFPTIQNVDVGATRLDPGKGLGIRASATITLSDHPFGDTGGFDRYRAGRTYNLARGSFWAKLIARQKYFENRRAIIRTGYLDDDGLYQAANFIAREYVVTGIAGPTEDGQVTVSLKDPLKFADSDRAQFPKASTGKLLAAISDTDTTLSVGTADIQQYKDAFDADQKYIRISDEVMLMTSVNVGAGAITVTRATLPGIYPAGLMLASGRDIGETVQVCYYFNAKRIDNVLQTLLRGDVSGVDAFLGAEISATLLADWSAISTAWLGGHVLSALIAEPTGVKKLLDELVQLNVWLWWDERIISPATSGKIKLDTIRTSLDPAETLVTHSEETSAVNGSGNIARDEKGRISRVLLFFGIRNPIRDLAEASNYTSMQVKVDLDAESPEKYGAEQYKTIYCRWLPTTAGLVADTICGRLLQEYRETKHSVSYKIDAKDLDVWTGGYVNYNTSLLTDFYGESITLPVMILEAQEGYDDGVPEYTLKGITRAVLGVSGGYTENTLGTWDASTPGERGANAYYADDTTETIPSGNAAPYTYK